MKPSGAHTHPGQGGGSAALVVLAVIVAAAIVGPIVQAFSSLLRVVVEVLEVVIIVVASAAGLAAIAGLTFLVIRLHHRHVRMMAAVSGHQPPRVIQLSGEAELANGTGSTEQRTIDAPTPRDYRVPVARMPEAADQPRTDASPG